ncbi:uncharacterized zinc finger protein CG12744 [Drosophila ficusphila]|uniref:uncharacterized zinc finger protein CG12744 n=1 Tax=Drosophila ficusphila TaxID=30025 RepID=UPI0007E62D9C|nr:uncharacterized zinc finger protein CG12744 [Drosophila ficusphila]XP_017045107.1 uncharacterized zinc finger protein CG12744 [Drosophila ficusphila]XP_017045108.1 uncharacterized zinc finger protein CG12744 [Drosophila ficusphila]
MEVVLPEIHLSCLLCDQTFDSVDKLNDHLSTHFPQQVARNQNCDLCGRGMRSSLELHEHYQRFHEAHVPSTDGHFSCQLCDKMFLLQEHLKVHVKLDHSTDRFRSEKSSEWENPKPISIDLTADDELDPILLPPPKRKYPPRSPFFNPNLWLDQSFM